MKFTRIKHLLFSALLATTLVSCYDNVVSSIPDYPVNLQLNLTAKYPNFRSPYQSLIFENRVIESDRIGYGGILVNIGADGLYYSFDMACPYEVKSTVRVYPNEIGQAVCESCGSIFNIAFGNGEPISGPAKETLKRYRTTLSGDILYISR